MRADARPVALYARVSTHDQTCENQLLELRRYAEARGWQTVEYVDHGVSGSKDRRPALDQLTADVKRHKVSATANRHGRERTMFALSSPSAEGASICLVRPNDPKVGEHAIASIAHEQADQPSALGLQGAYVQCCRVPVPDKYLHAAATDNQAKVVPPIGNR